MAHGTAAGAQRARYPARHPSRSHFWRSVGSGNTVVHARSRPVARAADATDARDVAEQTRSVLFVSGWVHRARAAVTVRVLPLLGQPPVLLAISVRFVCRTVLGNQLVSSRANIIVCHRVDAPLSVSAPASCAQWAGRRLQWRGLATKQDARPCVPRRRGEREWSRRCDSRIQGSSTGTKTSARAAKVGRQRAKSAGLRCDVRAAVKLELCLCLDRRRRGDTEGKGGRS